LWRIQDFENGQADSSGFASEAIGGVRCKVTENEALIGGVRCKVTENEALFFLQNLGY